MPSLHSALVRLSQHAFTYLRDTVRELEGEYALEHFDVTFDHGHAETVVMQIEFKGAVVWKRSFNVKGLSTDGVHIGDDALRDAVTNTMKAHLNLVAQMHFARLDQMFPKSISEVTMGYDIEKDQKLVIVAFKNGHKAIGPEHEAKTELFHARCAMLYDLPPI